MGGIFIFIFLTLICHGISWITNPTVLRKSRQFSDIRTFSMNNREETIQSSTAKQSSAAFNLIKKRKIKEIEQLLINSTQSNHYLHQFLHNGQRPYGVGKPSKFYEASIQRCLVKEYGTITVLPEYNKKADMKGFLIEIPIPEVMGGLFRDAGAKAIVVSMDPRTGGTSPEEFQRFAKEQYKQRKNLPGPLPLIWNDVIIDPIQISHAASLGAAAVTISPELYDDYKTLIQLCKSYEMEPIVFIKNYEDGVNAMKNGARCLCFHTLSPSEIVKLHTELKKVQGDYKESANATMGFHYTARLRTESESSTYLDIETAWMLREAEITSIWPSPEATYSISMSDIYLTIIAMRSKASRTFLSSRQFMTDRRKEGATEYLGDILY